MTKWLAASTSWLPPSQQGQTGDHSCSLLARPALGGVLGGCVARAHPSLPLLTHCRALCRTSSSTPASEAGSISTYSLSADSSPSRSSDCPVPLLPPRRHALYLEPATCMEAESV